jgi:hypothetical protein
MKIKILLPAFFILAATIAVGGSVYYSREFKNEDTQAGFGIGPPYVHCDPLGPGEKCEQKIIVMRSSPGEERKVRVKVAPPELEKFISTDPGPEFSFGPDAIRAEVSVKVEVPQDICAGRYAGAVYFLSSRGQADAGVSIALGARADIDIMIKGKDCAKEKNQGDVSYPAKDLKLYNRLKGKIVINMEDHGRAYFVRKEEKKVFSLGSPQDALVILKNFNASPDPARWPLVRPADALRLIRETGLGINGKDFSVLTGAK